MEDELGRPTDLDFTPATLRVDDELPPEDLRASVQGLRLTYEDLQEDYDCQIPQAMHLSELKRLFESRDEKRALNSLRSLHYLKIDDHFLHAYDDPDLAWAMHEVG